MNERLIVEEGLLVTMLIKVVRDGTRDLFRSSSMEAGRALQAAAREIIMQAPATARGKVARRIGNVGDRCVAPHVPAGIPPALFGLAVYGLLEHLVREEYISIGGASQLSTAIDLVLPALEPAAAVPCNLERSRAMAAAIFADVQAEGLFRDVRSMTES